MDYNLLRKWVNLGEKTWREFQCVLLCVCVAKRNGSWEATEAFLVGMCTGYFWKTGPGELVD